MKSISVENLPDTAYIDRPVFLDEELAVWYKFGGRIIAEIRGVLVVLFLVAQGTENLEVLVNGLSASRSGNNVVHIQWTFLFSHTA